MGEIKLEIARQIQANRERAGMSKKELGVAVGVAPNTVTDWENAKYAPGADTLVKLCGIFGITLDEIYGQKNPPSRWDGGEAEENIKIFKSFTEEQQREALKYASFLKQSKERGE